MPCSDRVAFHSEGSKLENGVRSVHQEEEVRKIDRALDDTGESEGQGRDDDDVSLGGHL